MPVMTTSSSNTTREVARLCCAAGGGVLVMPCMRVRLAEIESDCSALAQDAYRRFGMRLFGFRDGDNGGAMMMNWARCSCRVTGVIPRGGRGIQYSRGSSD